MTRRAKRKTHARRPTVSDGTVLSEEQVLKLAWAIHWKMNGSRDLSAWSEHQIKTQLVDRLVYGFRAVERAVLDALPSLPISKAFDKIIRLVSDDNVKLCARVAELERERDEAVGNREYAESVLATAMEAPSIARALAWLADEQADEPADADNAQHVIDLLIALNHERDAARRERRGKDGD